uniref:CSD domain-containing protein n=1 Tax=Meloidogyne javanica TaxID=6303 RepID=A0A915MTN5_MELJA
MTVETDLDKRVGELNLEKRVDGMEKMDKKLSTDSMNGESLEKRVRQLRGPIVIGRAQHGIVKWFSVAKGYSFIRVDGSEKDCFVHASAILRTVNVPLALIENQQVEFDIIEGLKGPEAVCVSGPGGVRVGKTIGYMYKGTFYHTYPRFRQLPMMPARYPAGQRRNDNNTVEQKNNMGKKLDAGGEKNLSRQKAIEGEGKAVVHDEKTTEGKTV